MAAEGAQPVSPASGNRAAALLVDCALLVALQIAGSSMAESVPHDELAARIAAFVAPLAYLTVFPVTALQGTPGKWICRIRLCDRSGRRLAWRRSLVRASATIGWLALALFLLRNGVEWGWGSELLGFVFAAFLAAWLPIAFTARGQSAFDLLAGTLVVRLHADPEAVSRSPGERPSRVEAIVAVVLCLLVGSCTGAALRLGRDRNLHSRVTYAIEATMPLRESVQAFHDRERRWPTAAELGVPEWKAYPDGGGYRLQQDGSVLIGFSVLPELKGRTILLRPIPDVAGRLEWKCSADPGLDRAYVAAACR